MRAELLQRHVRNAASRLAAQQASQYLSEAVNIYDYYTRRSADLPLAPLQQLLREDISLEQEEGPGAANWSVLGSQGQLVGGRIYKEQLQYNAELLRAQAFKLYYTNPHVRSVIRTETKYVFGKGVHITLNEKRAGRKKAAEQWIETWQDENEWNLKEKEMGLRSFRDGELFAHNRRMGKGKVPQLEYVDPDSIASTDLQAKQGIVFDPQNPSKPLEYHVVRSAVGKPLDFQKIPADRMLHIKLFVDSNVHRGRSMLEPILYYVKLYDDWIRDRMVLNRVRSAVALVRTTTGTAQQVQTAILNKNKAEDARGKRQKTRMFKSGSIITAPAGTQYQMLSANLGASDAKEDGRNILLAMATGVDLPEMMLTADWSNANYASSMTAQNPFIRTVEDWQDFFESPLSRLWRMVLQTGIDQGDLDPATDLKVTCEWPELIYREFKTFVDGLAVLYNQQIISATTFATKTGFDYEAEQEKRRLEDEKAIIDQEELRKLQAETTGEDPNAPPQNQPPQVGPDGKPLPPSNGQQQPPQQANEALVL